MIRPLALAAALAAATPAASDGYVGLTVTPRTAEEVALVRLGLAAHALRRDIEANGTITQRGARNLAAISQGGCDWALIEQRGSGHRGSIDQRGCGNVGALFQSGRGTDAALAQYGGGTGVVFLHGF